MAAASCKRRLWHWQKRKHVQGLLCNTSRPNLAALNCTKLFSNPAAAKRKREEREMLGAVLFVHLLITNAN